MNKGTQTLIVAIIVFLAGFLYITFSHKTGPSIPAQTPTPTLQQVTLPPASPTASLSATITVQPSTNQTQNCTKTDIKATSSFDAAAGTVYGTFILKNTSQHSCTIPVGSYLTLNFNKSVKNLQIIQTRNQPASGVEAFTVKPGSSLKAQIRYPNGPQCPGPVKEIPLTYTINLSSTESTLFSDEIGKTEMSINVCESESAMTTVQVAPFTP